MLSRFVVVDGFRKNETEMPGVSNHITDLLDRGWHYATLFFGETQIRSGHILIAAFKQLELRRALVQISKEFREIDADQVARDPSLLNELIVEEDEMDAITSLPKLFDLIQGTVGCS